MLHSFFKRAGTAIFIAGSQLGVAFLGQRAVFILYGAVMLLALWEFYRMTEFDKIKPQKINGILLSLLIYSLSFLWFTNSLGAKYMLISVFLGILILIFELYRKKEQPFSNLSHTMMGVAYVGFPFATILFFTAPPQTGYEYSFEILIGFLLLQWVNDSGAYFAGSLFGKHKMFPRVSPKKSWEGLMGGVVLSLIVAWLIFLLLGTISLYAWLGMSIIVSIFGTFGDLVESLYKRTVGVKDSGNLLPGHGGFLDRFDSILFSAPATWAFLYLIN